MNFNQRLAAYRKSKGISQEGLADMLGVSRQAVSKWETGESQPEMGNLIAICEILQVSPNDLIGYEGVFDSQSEKAGGGVMSGGKTGAGGDRKPGGDGKGGENEKSNGDGKPGGDAKLAGDRMHGRKLKAIVAAVIILCLIIGGAAGYFIGRDSVATSQKSILSGLDNMIITGLVYEFTPGDERGNLRLTFVPSVADESLRYEVVRIEKDGETKTFPAEYNEGTCTAFVDTVENVEVTFTAKVSDGERVLSQGLIKIEDSGDNTYIHEEIWK